MIHRQQERGQALSAAYAPRSRTSDISKSSGLLAPLLPQVSRQGYSFKVSKKRQPYIAELKDNSQSRQQEFRSISTKSAVNGVDIQRLGIIRNSTKSHKRVASRVIKKKGPFPVPKTFFIAKGNNHTLVSSVLEANCIEPVPFLNKTQLIWLQDLRTLGFFDPDNKSRVVLNMFERHYQLTNKQMLYRNLCSQHKEKAAQIMPRMFQLNFNRSSTVVQEQLTDFLKFYLDNCPRRGEGVARIKKFFEVERSGGKKFRIKLKNLLYRHLQNSDRDKGRQDSPVKFNQQNSVQSQQDIKKKLQTESSTGHSAPIDNNSHQQSPQHNKIAGKSSKNGQRGTYILKPLEYKKGMPKESHIFSKLSKLQRLLHEDLSKSNLKMYKHPVHEVSTSHFSIERYIKNTLLINKRKFDMRVWVLIDQKSRLYFCRQGDLKMGPEEVVDGSKDLKNIQINLGKNAVSLSKQPSGPPYTYMSFQELRNHLQRSNQVIKWQTLLGQIKQHIVATFTATRDKLQDTVIRNSTKTAQPKKVSFQLFGYDFIVEQTGKVWLLKVVANPSLEENSPVKCHLLRRMLQEVVNIGVLCQKPNPDSLFERLA